MRNLRWPPGILVLVLLLGACTGPPDVRWAQGQAAYNKAADTLILYRAPCVDQAAYAGAGPDHPLCRVDNATWDVVYPLMQAADKCLRAADARIQAGSEAAAVDSLDCAERALERLLIYQLSTPTGS